MSYADDIFLSYAHLDDVPFNDPKGWVSNFLERLKIRLEQMLGRETELWWDGRMQGNEYVVGEIADRITGTRFLVSVVTPRYVRSEWCKGELHEFCRLAELNGGLRRKNLSRLFKVVKTPVGDEEQPGLLREVNGYTFYEFDEKKRLREFRQELAPNKDQRYWDRLDDLAWDIKQTIAEFEDGAGGTHAGRRDGSTLLTHARPAAPSKGEVYLAETAPDVDGERDRLRRELTHHGFYVLPEGELPRRAAELEQAVRESLARCALSVHMLGAGYGAVPDGAARWAGALQEELAAERAAADPTFSRVIWMPAGLAPEDLRQRELVARLRAGLDPSAELLETGVEGLKTRILEKLNSPKAGRKEGRGDGRPLIYLMRDDRDAEAAARLADYVAGHGHGCRVVTPDDAGGEQAARHHRQSLVECDAALVYYGAANPLWVYTKLWDVQKAQGWGRSAPLDLAAVYMGDPRTPEKEQFPSEGILVIDGFDAREPEGLRPLLSAARAKGGRR